MEAKGTVQSLDRDRATVALQSPTLVTAEPQRSVTLYCSILKRENFVWVVQKCTEVGVKAIIPIIAERTVKTGINMDRLRMIAKEAAEQSGRGIIPHIFEPMDFTAALLKAKNESIPHIFYHRETSIAPFSNLQSPISGIWIGPEGGWTPEEVAEAENSSFQISSLGKLTLRAETAAIVGSYMAVNADIDTHTNARSH